MRILLFLLDTVFFLLTAAALLRGWMNTRRLRMTQQPGLFAMAITDWIVQPVRRVLPRAWVQANVDWGSFVAAVILSLLYALIWHLLLQSVAGWGGGGAWAVGVPVLALTFLVRAVLQGWMLLILAYAIFSWVQPMSLVHASLDQLVSPLLRPVRRLIPPIGGVDLSVFIVLVVLQICLMLLTP
ncbi:MAG TPA: YggT family protein [Macromonas sp.]|nr:YggT family protein [Macromonas sp.]